MTVQDILARGYFPKELPNPFVSAPFAVAVTGPGVALPRGFVPTWKTRVIGIPATKAARYSLARGGLPRRALSVPNPVSQFALAREIDANWVDLQSSVGGTPLAATRPVLASSGRAIQGLRAHGFLPESAAATRRNNRYILKTDISRFYQSIYTHSIPWALHGKALAKAERGSIHLGNRLDVLLRAAQDQQTVGIPIGPDTSLVCAEILMQACDRDLLERIPGLRGHRFIDDYELGFRTRTAAENAYHILESILSEYELALNSRKTEVVELPAPLEASWSYQLSHHPIHISAMPRRKDLLGYFSLAFELARLHVGDSVLQYAVASLRNIRPMLEDWQLFCTLLLDCAVPEPACLRYVLEIVIGGVNAGAACPRADLEETLNATIGEHSELNHASEVAWSLWACLALAIPIHEYAAQQVVACDNSFVALLALHADSVRLVQGGLNPTLWATYMTTAALYEENWLLAYEASIKGWLPSVGGGNHIAPDSNFAFLKASHVSFYDAAQAVPSAPAAPIPMPSAASGFEIVAYGSDNE